MKVFISWSGALSKQVAEHLKTWVKCTLQATEPFVSFEDIEKGAFWFSEMGNKLAESDFGIVCLTKDNLTAPWVLFEAGALSKGLTKNRVCTLLVNFPASDLVKPLSEFQATLPSEEDMLKLALSLNKGLPEPLEKEVVQRTFSAFWPGFKKEFDAAVVKHRTKGPPPRREQYDLVTEILAICQSMQKGLQQVKEVKDFEKRNMEEVASRFERIVAIERKIAQNATQIEQVEFEIRGLEVIAKEASAQDREGVQKHILECRDRLHKLQSDALLFYGDRAAALQKI